MNSIRPLLRIVPLEPVKTYPDGVIDGIAIGERMVNARFFWSGALAGIVSSALLVILAAYL